MRTLHTIVAIIALAFVATPVFADDVDDPQMNRQLAASAEAAREMLEQKMGVIAADMQTAAAAIAGKGLRSPDARQALKDLCAKHASFVDCATIDPKGVIVAIEPTTYRKLEGVNVSGQDQVTEIIRTHKPVFSDVFKAIEGFWAVDFEWPILAADSGENRKKDKETAPAYEGSVSAISKPAVFMNNLLKPYVAKGIKDVWIMQTDGKVIASRDPDTIGGDFLPATTSSSETTLPQLLSRIVKEPKGTGSYRSYPSGQGEARQIWCGWTTARSEGNEHRVIVFQR